MQILTVVCFCNFHPQVVWYSLRCRTGPKQASILHSVRPGVYSSLSTFLRSHYIVGHGLPVNLKHQIANHFRSSSSSRNVMCVWQLMTEIRQCQPSRACSDGQMHDLKYVRREHLPILQLWCQRTDTVIQTYTAMIIFPQISFSALTHSHYGRECVGGKTGQFPCEIVVGGTAVSPSSTCRGFNHVGEEITGGQWCLRLIAPEGSSGPIGWRMWRERDFFSRWLWPGRCNRTHRCWNIKIQ